MQEASPGVGPRPAQAREHRQSSAESWLHGLRWAPPTLGQPVGGQAEGAGESPRCESGRGGAAAGVRAPAEKDRTTLRGDGFQGQRAREGGLSQSDNGILVASSL